LTKYAIEVLQKYFNIYLLLTDAVSGVISKNFLQRNKVGISIGLIIMCCVQVFFCHIFFRHVRKIAKSEC